MHNSGTDLRKFDDHRGRDASREIVRVNILRHRIQNANLVIFWNAETFDGRACRHVRPGGGGVWEFAFVIHPGPSLYVLR